MAKELLYIQNLLKRSSTLDIHKAAKEWDLIGPEFGPPGKCDYCGRRKVKLRFKILNRLNGNEMFVGFGCLRALNRIGLQFIDEDFNLMSDKDIEIYAVDCWYVYKKEMKKRSTLKCLEELNKHTDVQGILDDFKKDGFFDMFKVPFLIAEFQENNVYYDNSMFKINLRKKSVREEFLKLEGEFYEILYPSLSTKQRQMYEER